MVLPSTLPQEIKDIDRSRTKLASEARMPGQWQRLVPGNGLKRIELWAWGEAHTTDLRLIEEDVSSLTLQANYTFTHAIDNVLNSNPPSESNAKALFLAIAGLSNSLSESASGTDGNGQTNADGPYINTSAIHTEGDILQRRKYRQRSVGSSLSHPSAPWYVQLPWKFESRNLRAPERFHYSKAPADVGLIRRRWCLTERRSSFAGHFPEFARTAYAPAS